MKEDSLTEIVDEFNEELKPYRRKKVTSGTDNAWCYAPPTEGGSDYKFKSSLNLLKPGVIKVKFKPKMYKYDMVDIVNRLPSSEGYYLSLNFGGCAIFSEQLQVLVQRLQQKNVKVGCLILDDCSIDEGHIEAMCNFILNSGIVFLSLKSTGLDSKMCREIFNAAINSKTLLGINLSGNFLKKEDEDAANHALKLKREAYLCETGISYPEWQKGNIREYEKQASYIEQVLISLFRSRKYENFYEIAKALRGDRWDRAVKIIAKGHQDLINKNAKPHVFFSGNKKGFEPRDQIPALAETSSTDTEENLPVMKK